MIYKWIYNFSCNIFFKNLDSREFVFIVAIDEKVFTEELQRRNSSSLSPIFVQKGTVCSQYLCCDLNNSNLGRVRYFTMSKREDKSQQL